MIVTIDNIPVYNALITDEETGMFKISLVDDPAVQSNFLAFDANRKPLMYSIENEEKRIVRGVIMRADFPIYRRDDSGEFYVIYKADTIRQMAEKYLFENRQNDVNLMHQDGTDVEGVQMVQYFIKDSENGVNPKGFEDIKDGSLFAEFHIVNDEVWAAIKDGTYVGFSLEGVFDLAPEKEKDIVEQIVDELNGNFSKQHKNMTKKERIMAALEKLLVKCGNITTDKGILVWDGEDELKAEMEVYVEDAEGTRTPAEDGEYVTEDGKTIVVAGGKVVEITDPKAEVAPEAEPAAEPEPVEAEGEPAEEPAPEAPAAEEPKEVKDIEKEIEDIWAAINAIIEMLNGSKVDVEEMKATLSKIANAPAAKPAHAEVIEAGKETKTGVKGLDNLARILSAK